MEPFGIQTVISAQNEHWTFKRTLALFSVANEFL